MSDLFTRIGVALHKLVAASNVDDAARKEIHDLGTELQQLESDLAGVRDHIDAQVADLVAAKLGSFNDRLTSAEANIVGLINRADAVDAGLQVIDSLIEGAPAGDDTVSASASADNLNGGGSSDSVEEPPPPTPADAPSDAPAAAGEPAPADAPAGDETTAG